MKKEASTPKVYIWLLLAILLSPILSLYTVDRWIALGVGDVFCFEDTKVRELPLENQCPQEFILANVAFGSAIVPSLESKTNVPLFRLMSKTLVGDLMRQPFCASSKAENRQFLIVKCYNLNPLFIFNCTYRI